MALVQVVLLPRLLDEDADVELPSRQGQSTHRGGRNERRGV
jgi:hypothetical protein